MNIERSVFSRHLVCLLAGIALAGCIEVIPVDVEETVVVDRDGKITVDYQGTFNDLREFAMAVAADNKEKPPSGDELRSTAIDSLRRDPRVTEVTELSEGVYRLHWQDGGTLGKGKVPQLLAVSYGSEKIPRLLEMANVDSLSSSAYRIGAIDHTDLAELEDDPRFPKDSRSGKLIEEYFKRFKGKVGIRIDSSFVLKHNATSVTAEPGGRLHLQWNLAMPMTHGVELLLSLDKRDIPAFKLMDSPKGSSCVELIGSNCKCGPFMIRNHRGDSQANAPYEITAPTGVHRGCTDADGNTIAIESPVTGTCEVRLPRDSASSSKCKGESAATPAPKEKGK